MLLAIFCSVLISRIISSQISEKDNINLRMTTETPNVAEVEDSHWLIIITIIKPVIANIIFQSGYGPTSAPIALHKLADFLCKPPCDDAASTSLFSKKI